MKRRALRAEYRRRERAKQLGQRRRAGEVLRNVRGGQHVGIGITVSTADGDEGVTPRTIGEALRSGDAMWHVKHDRNTPLGSPSITSPTSRLSWQLPLGESHQGVALFTKGSLKVSDSSWLSAVMSLKPPPKMPGRSSWNSSRHNASPGSRWPGHRPRGE